VRRAVFGAGVAKTRKFNDRPFPYHTELELEITTLTNLGSGLGRVPLPAAEGTVTGDGWVVMVPFALPGECGGCQYQHLDYAAQLRWKHRQIGELFRRVGGFDPSVVQPVIPCPNPYHYRNRILVRSQWNKPAQKLNLGFMRTDCGLVCDIESCAIAEPALNEAITQWRRNPPPKGGICGVGFFSIEVADAVESFVGVELDAPAIRAARRNQESRGIRNGSYVAGDTDQVLPSLLAKWNPAETAVLLDPPRVGCRPPSLEVLRKTGPGQILYVSCHPATLARDLKILCADGRYRLETVLPLDMFPQTQHVECVADLRLAGPLTAESVLSPGPVIG